MKQAGADLPGKFCACRVSSSQTWAGRHAPLTLMLRAVNTREFSGLYVICMRGVKGSAWWVKLFPKSSETKIREPWPPDTIAVRITCKNQSPAARGKPVRVDQKTQSPLAHSNATQQKDVLSQSSRGRWRCQTPIGWKCCWWVWSRPQTSCHSPHWWTEPEMNRMNFVTTHM